MTAPARVKRGRLAESMPSISAWVADMRQAFGDELMDDVITRGRAGEPVFYATENGHSFGTKSAESENVWRGDGLNGRRFCDRCDGACVGTGRRCSAAPGDRAR